MTNLKKRYIHFIIMFALTIIIAVLPPFGQVTPYGMKALAIFVGVLYGWIFIDLIWPSIFGFVALAIFGIMNATAAFSAGFGNMQFVMMFIVIAFAGILEATGLSDFLSTFLLKKKFFRKSPWRLIIGFCVIAYALGIASASIAACFLLWSIVLRCVDLCDIPKKDPMVPFIIFMIAISAFAGNFIVPFAAGSAIFIGFFTQAMSITIPFVPYILFATTITVLNVVLMLLFGKFVLRLDVSKLVLPEEMVRELDSKTITKRQKTGFIILVVYLVALLLPELIPALPGMVFLKGLGLVGISALGILVLGFLSVDGEPLVDLTTSMKNAMHWPLLMLLAVTFPLADVLKSADAGIMPTINAVILPIVSQMGPYPFLIVSMILLGILTQFTHNIVLGAMFTPILCPLIEQIGGNPIVMFFFIFLSLQASYATPAASAQAALIHGHEAMQRKYAYMLGIVDLVIVWIVLAVVGLPLGQFLF